MKALLAWFTARQTCACGGFKPPRADKCFDCTLTSEHTRPAGRHAAQ
jgi:hypothetical protein